MKPLSDVAPGLLDIQIQIHAVCRLHCASTYQTLGAKAQKVDFIISTFCSTFFSVSVVILQ